MVIPDEVLLRDAAYDLIELFARQGGDVLKVQGVVGPQTGATKLAELLSDQIAALTRGECFWASPKKSESDGKRSMVFSNEDLGLLPCQSVLLCEDALTTGGSVDLTAAAVTNSDGIVLPYVVALVNRSGLTEISGKNIVALINCLMPMWKPEECPLCGEDSEAIHPKGEENWARLNASY